MILVGLRFSPLLIARSSASARAAGLHDLLREMHREHTLTSIIATHNASLAAACDRVLRLEGGRLRAEA